MLGMNRDRGDPADDIAVVGAVALEHHAVRSIRPHAHRAERLAIERRAFFLQGFEAEHDVTGGHRTIVMPARGLMDAEGHTPKIVRDPHAAGQDAIIRGAFVRAGDDQPVIDQPDIGWRTARIDERVRRVERPCSREPHGAALRCLGADIVEGGEAGAILHRSQWRERMFIGIVRPAGAGQNQE